MGHAVIVGAGPGGAALAYLLARRGIEVTLLERQSDFAREFRGELLLPGGLETFEQMGLWKEFEAVPHVTFSAFEAYVGGERRMRAEFDAALFGRLPPRWLSQPALLEMLVAQGSRQPSFRFERGATVRGLLQDDGRVAGVRVLSASGEREIRGDLVIGADGRTSMVRHRGGFVARTDPTPMDVVWFKVPRPDFLAADPHARVYLGHGHMLIAAPIYDAKLQVAWIIPKGSFGEIRESGLPECIQAMARHVSADLAKHLLEHRDRATEPFLLRVVSDRVEEWTKPGALLIGDAAHTMSPVGAQGLNIALRDAIVAANQLVPALGGHASASEIDAAARRVQEQRLPEVAAIQRIQAIPPRILLRDTWWSRVALRILPVLMRSDILRGRRGGTVFRRIAWGVTDVHLEV